MYTKGLIQVCETVCEQFDDFDAFCFHCFFGNVLEYCNS